MEIADTTTKQLQFRFCEEEESPVDRKRRRDRERAAHRRAKDGDAIRQYNRLWRQRNIDRCRQAGRRKYHNNIEVNRRRGRELYAKNRDRILASAKQRRKADPERFRTYRKERWKKVGRLKPRPPASESQKKAQAERNARWKLQNRDRSRSYLRQYIRNRMKDDPAFAEAQRQRRRVWAALRRSESKKEVGTLGLIGCTANELRMHIEAQFTDGMAWSNRSEWHVDHIIPLASFDLTDKATHSVAFHYTNLRPLWRRDNLSKGAKMPHEIPNALAPRIGSFLVNLAIRGPAIRQENACRSDQIAS